MSHSIKIKTKGVELRKKGYSLKEISEKLHIAKSTASEWLSGITLSPTAQKRLMKKQIFGQYKTVLLKAKTREFNRKAAEEKAFLSLKKHKISKEFIKLSCALMWWCEGNKDTSMLRFTSSDITLIKNFLLLLRSAFNIDESKFRALIHLHTYHNDVVQKKFWSNITGIPLKQFHQSYQKTNTGVRTKEGYPGCIAITYYDAVIAKELEAIYNVFSKNSGAFVNG